ncbi:AraC family transcriptional regulator [Metabacillus sp. 113a]|uniref:AraC family transcriptional regulator n=1 Tax=Metabacillus sp. 113a TaxID=3404706 RepID=UPI003CEBD3CF
MNIRHDQQKHLERVIDYIEENIQEALPLEKLAAVSTYSAFHFQRLFKRMTGETPATYVKRLRLEDAAHLLIYEPDLPVTHVAHQCGFSSLSYFTSSFREAFESSPKEWREGSYLARFPREYKDSKKSKLFSKNREAIWTPHHYNQFRWLDLSKVQIIHLPSCKTEKRHHMGSYISGIPQTWGELYHWANARDLIHQDALMLGYPKNNPYITPPEKSRYECHIELESRTAEGVNLSSFHGGKHVLYEFDEPVPYSDRGMLIECYSELYSFWLPGSGFKYLGKPVELVQVRPLPGTLKLDCRIKAIALAIEPK